MKEVLFSLPGVALTILCWGTYGTVLHEGQHHLGNNRLKPLICVGLAYFVIAIIVPCVLLVMQGKLGGDWTRQGIFWSLTAGAAGAFGALGIVLAMTAGGKPTYVMPLVFGGAPIINVIVATRWKNIPWTDVSPVFFAGLIMVGAGAVTVLVFAPTGKKMPPPPAQAAAVEPAKQESAATEEKPDDDPQEPQDSGDTDEDPKGSG